MEPGMYDIKIYEGKEEMETIRDLTETQVKTISDVLHRNHIMFLIKKITERTGE